MKRKDILIIAALSLVLGMGMILFHTNKKTDKMILDKSQENTMESLPEEFEQENQAIRIAQQQEQKKKEEVVVYISGEVKNPQVVEMKSGDRLIDAVEKCGGLTEEADKNAVNLALLLKDEEHYVIVKKGEGIHPTTSSQEQKKENILNLNTAEKADLMQLPNVGEKTADKILQYREENGKFSDIEELKNVGGIGDKKYEQIKDLIHV